ncbi:hypothetical protein FOZ60_007472 [Perkinsus olseni]|uniref:subtilisin n=1 Tax=Perkinsus olseni TaxID=32597 RepID=A0A7J6PNT8_PEROL|nr:hypothetical protein FOZ60_007472 [Perkinsus olseni]
MRTAALFSLASLVGATIFPRDTILSIKSGDDDIDVRHLPQMLRNYDDIPDEEVASFLSIAEIRTLKYVHLQVVQTSPSTIGSDTLCKFVTEASSKLSLESNCAIDVDGGVFWRPRPKEDHAKEDAEAQGNDTEASNNADDNERAPLSKLVAAIDMAINVRVDIAEISVGFKFSSREAAQRGLLLQALHAAQEHDILLVSPAGNDGKDASDVLPCSLGGPRAICVAAMMDWKKLNVLHPRSNFGPKVDIAAFGYRILTGRLTDAPGGRLRSFSGTCASSAFAAGALAILISMGIDSGKAKQLIEESTDQMNYIIPERYPHRIKGGALDVLKAVESAISWVSSKQRSLHDGTGFASVE